MKNWVAMPNSMTQRFCRYKSGEWAKRQRRLDCPPRNPVPPTIRGKAVLQSKGCRFFSVLLSNLPVSVPAEQPLR